MDFSRNSKFLSGVLSDLLGSPVLIFSLGLMCTGILNIAFSAASTVPLFTTIWVINGLFQGCGATWLGFKGPFSRRFKAVRVVSRLDFT